MLRQFFPDSSVIETSVRSTQTKGFRPTNLDEAELTQNHSSTTPVGGSLSDANSIKAEVINILGEEPIKSTSKNSVSPYSISHKNDTTSGKPPGTYYTASSIFTFTKPIDSTANNNNLTSSSSTPDSGVVIKPNNLFLEKRHAPAWTNALSRPSSSHQSPPTSASLMGEATSASYSHHAHHLHHRPFYLHHYCNPPISPTTKDVTVQLSSPTNPPITGVNNVISTTTQVLHTVKENLPTSYSRRLQTSPLSNQPPISQIPHSMNPVSSTDIMSSSLTFEDDNESNTTTSDSFIKDNP